MVKFPSCTGYPDALRCISGIKGRSTSSRLCGFTSRWHTSLLRSQTRRSSTSNGVTFNHSSDNHSAGEETLVSLRKIPTRPAFNFKTYFDFPEVLEDQVYPHLLRRPFRPEHQATFLGFLGKKRNKSKYLSFADLDLDQAYGNKHVQIVSTWVEGDAEQAALHNAFKAIPSYSPVSATGVLVRRLRKVGSDGTQDEANAPGDESEAAWDLRLDSIQCLNEFPKDIIVSRDAVYKPSERHLQMRFEPALRDRLRFRETVALHIRNHLKGFGFTEVETPILFKSTPEGAREFLVPTRQPGQAYALPQSPQQYKQILMASGMRKYFQFARCFRDEDSRADRQPEFTQLDLEIAFTSGKGVKLVVEHLLGSIFKMLHARKIPRLSSSMQSTAAVPADTTIDTQGHKQRIRTPKWPHWKKLHNMVEITYQIAMSQHGSDKPDRRIPSTIQRIDHMLPNSFVNMITSLENPIVEAQQFRLQGTPAENLAFIRGFMDNLPKTPLKLSPNSTPGIFMFDETKPLNGLSAFGYEGAEKLAGLEDKSWKKLEHGDIVIVHAREDIPFRGEGWTDLGKLRKAVYDAAIQQGLLPVDHRLLFCWVTQFPLFTPDEHVAGEGQGGVAGLKATHHPFTAPLTADDFDLLETEPLKAKADHYDLVVNGVEVGGGSRRIHVAEMQEYVMRVILKMPESGVAQFAHLLEALRAGCPPHAGFALGFDRLISILCDVESVRDVIAFPKNFKGEDLLVKSPSTMTREQMNTYHLSPQGWDYGLKKVW